MNDNKKYILCFIIGIILFILWNSINGFSIGVLTEEEIMRNKMRERRIQNKNAQDAQDIQNELAQIDRELEYLAKLENELEDEVVDEIHCLSCFNTMETNPKEQNTCNQCYNTIFINQLKEYLQINFFASVQDYLDRIDDMEDLEPFKFVPPNGLTIKKDYLDKLNIIEMKKEDESRILLMKLIVHDRAPDQSFEDQMIGNYTSIMDQYWGMLTTLNQDDLTTLGWTQQTWDGNDDAGIEPDSNPYFLQRWSTMSQEKHDAAIRLGPVFVDHFRSIDADLTLCQIESNDQAITDKHIAIAKSLGIDLSESDFTGISQCCGGSSGPGGLSGGSSGPSGLSGGGGGGGSPDWPPSAEDMPGFIEKQFVKYQGKIHRDVILAAAQNQRTRNLYNCYLRERFSGKKWGKK